MVAAGCTRCQRKANHCRDRRIGAADRDRRRHPRHGLHGARPHHRRLLQDRHYASEQHQGGRERSWKRASDSSGQAMHGSNGDGYRTTVDGVFAAGDCRWSREIGQRRRRGGGGGRKDKGGGRQ
eukprot:766718-Hanusia_phi.AAC.5